MAALGDAIKGALAAIRGVAGVPVTYRRGNDSVALTATVGRTQFRNDAVGETNSRVANRIESRDYLIAAVDLILGGNRATPQRGDLIEEATAQGTVATYRVVSNFGEPVWRWSDGLTRSTMRIHTTAVDEV